MSRKQTKKIKTEEAGGEAIQNISEGVKETAVENLEKQKQEESKAAEKHEAENKETENKETENKSENEKQEKSDEEEKKRHGKAKWVVLAIVVILMLSLSGGYVGMAMYYRTRFLPGSSINGIDCSNMEVKQAAVLVDAQIETYSLQIWGRDYATGQSSTLIGEIVPGDIALSYIDSMGGVESLLAEQNEWNWIQAYTGRISSGYSLIQGVQFDEDKLKKVISSWMACQKDNMLQPQDAYISEYRDDIGGYVVIPETISTELNLESVMECVGNAVYAMQTTVDLEKECCYIEAKITRTDSGLNDLVDTVNTWLGTKISYDWNGNEVVLGLETLKDWITMEEAGPSLDEEAVKAFVKEQAKKYNTYGKKKKFVTALGIELTLDSPNYGWRTDTEAETEELIQLIYQGGVTEREPVYSVTAMEKGDNDIGGDYVEADLTHQHLYVYQDSEIAFETDFVSGKMNIEPSCATPPGIFGLTYKTRNATLRGADYASFVNYWMPFFGNYGMHDATWRKDFGATIFMDYGSHGCINLPLDAAAVIYDYVSTGFPVICYYYEVDPLGPPAETQMPSEEELLMQQEPTISQGMGEPAGDNMGNPMGDQTGNPMDNSTGNPGENPQEISQENSQENPAAVQGAE